MLDNCTFIYSYPMTESAMKRKQYKLLKQKAFLAFA